MYNFLLVSHCKYSSVLHHFQVIWHYIISWRWNLGYRSLRATETGTIRKLGYSFLFTFHYGCLVSFPR